MAGRAARDLASLASGAEAPDWLEASLLPPAAGARPPRPGPPRHPRPPRRAHHPRLLPRPARRAPAGGAHPSRPHRRCRRPSRSTRSSARPSRTRLRDGYGDPGNPASPDARRPRLRPAGDRRGAHRPAPGRAPRRRPRRRSLLVPKPWATSAAGWSRPATASTRLIAPRLRRARAGAQRDEDRRRPRSPARPLGGRRGAGRETLTGWFAELLPENLVDHLRKWGKGKLEPDRGSTCFGEVAAELAGRGGRPRAGSSSTSTASIPSCSEPPAARSLPLLGRVERELRLPRRSPPSTPCSPAPRSLLADHPEVRRAGAAADRSAPGRRVPGHRPRAVRDPALDRSRRPAPRSAPASSWWAIPSSRSTAGGAPTSAPTTASSSACWRPAAR